MQAARGGFRCICSKVVGLLLMVHCLLLLPLFVCEGGGCSRFCSYAVLTMYKMQNFLVLRKKYLVALLFFKFLIAILLLVLVLLFFHDWALGRSPVCLLDLFSAYE